MRLLALFIVGAALAAGCGSEPEESGTPGAGAEAAWLELVRGIGLEPAQGFVEIAVSRGPGELDVVLVLSDEAPEEVFFADGLYGAVAYTFVGASWERVDTAEIRTQVAPLLHKGEKAQVTLPVEPAETYRVLVPAEGKASWADST